MVTPPMNERDGSVMSDALGDAATTIIALRARVEELEGAVRDLLDCPDIADNDHKDEETHAAERRARKTLGGSNG